MDQRVETSGTEIAGTEPPPAPMGWASSPLTARVTAISVAVIATILAVAALRTGKAVAVPTVLAGFFAFTLTPLAARLERVGLPRAMAAIAVVLVVLMGIGAAVYILLPTAEGWNQRAPSMIRTIEEKLRDIGENVTENVEEVAPVAAATGDDPQTDAGDAAQELVESGRQLLTDTALGTPAVFAGMLYATFATLFLMIERKQIGRAVLGCGARYRNRRALARAMMAIQRSVTSYLLAITLINIGLGVATGVVFYLLDVPSPAVWGAAMTLLNFAPYIGPMIMNVVVLCVGLVSFYTVEEALVPVAALMLLNLLEGNIITPQVVGNQARIGAVPVLVAVAFGVWLWGAAGALLATPCLLVAHVLLMELNRPARPDA